MAKITILISTLGLTQRAKNKIFVSIWVKIGCLSEIALERGTGHGQAVDCDSKTQFACRVLWDQKCKYRELAEQANNARDTLCTAASLLRD